MKAHQMTPEEKKREAQKLASNTFLPYVLSRLESDIIQRWKGADTTAGDREGYWTQIKAIQLVAGAIERECKRAIARGGDV